MPTAVVDPFGNTIQACSISTAVKAKFKKDDFSSEATWAAHVKSDAWNVIRTKMKNNEIIKNTVIGRGTGPGGQYKMVYKGNNSIELTLPTKVKTTPMPDYFSGSSAFTNVDWDFGPNMAKLAQAEKAVVDTPTKLFKHVGENPPKPGEVLVTGKYEGEDFEVIFEYDNESFLMSMAGDDPFPVDADALKDILDSLDANEVLYKVGQVPNVPPAAGLPVASTSKSVGALTNEDAATMFVKTKDKLANEAGINIKGASGKLDELVYKTIADQAGYTPAEMLAKVEAYKGSGKKLSALKKKVLPKTGNPTKVATEKSVNTATKAVKKEEILPEEVPQVWDSEAVAKAYVKAKDHVVATNNNGWTLYTKNDQFDAEIHKWMQADLGPIKPDTAATAVADYIANHQKLSVLKKQMIKKGELTPQADTLKGKKVAISGPEDLKKALLDDPPSSGMQVAELTDSVGAKYKLTYEGFEGIQFTPFYELKFPSGTVQKWSHKDLEEVLSGKGFTIEYKLGGKATPDKPAPKETGAGQAGKSTVDPKKVDAKHELTPEQKEKLFLQWEANNLPISSSGAKIYQEAKYLSAEYGLGTDVLPILRAIDEAKTKKFGLAPSQNKILYDNKVKEHLKNPNPSPYSPSSSAPSFQQNADIGKVWGEDPPDAGLFEDISPTRMTEVAEKGMRKPTVAQQRSIRYYTGSEYIQINGRLRKNGGHLEGDDHAVNINKAMSPLATDVISRRGTSLQGLGMQSFEQLQGSVGKKFTEPAFSSTAVGGTGQFGGQVALKIQSPKGTMATWFKPFSNIPGENELVLAAGTKFEILKVEVKSGNFGTIQYEVTVRVVEQRKYR